MVSISPDSAWFAPVRWLSSASAVSAVVLLFACAGAQAQDDATANQDGAAVMALGVNNALFVAQSVPASMAPGSVHNVAVTMKNTGSASWPAGGVYRLGSQNPQDNARWGGPRAALGAAVPSGGQGSFSFQVTAPSTPGTYGFQWRMVQEGVAWFGPLTPNVAVTVAGAAPRNDARLTAQSVPAQMNAGKSYTVSLTLKNTGTSTWKSADGYVLGAQNPQDNRLWNASGRVALGATVAPGQQYTFSFPVAAPAAGAYSMQWRMLREGDAWFGGTSSSPVTVAGAAGGDIVTYIHTDALGSPVARSDAAGNVISRTRYEPYGATAGGVTPTIGFAGHVNDADTGLVYMQQRYYDPVAGRFLSIDPVVTDANSGSSFNRYAYAANSPYKYIDPDGRNPWLLRAGFEASYFIATRAGAGVLGSMIGIAIYDAIHSDSNVDKPGTAVGTGCIYCVSGDKTSSGKDYIGSTDDMDKRKKDTSDGRDRNGATIIDTYLKGDKEERRTKEQQAINDKGGKGETDNRRNEISESKWPASGVKPPEPKQDPPRPPEPK